LTESRLPPIRRARAQIAAAAVSAVLLAAAGFLPLFGGPGYEAALIAGLVLPVTVAVATAIESALAEAGPFEAVGRGTLAGFCLALIALLLALLHGLRVGFCDPLHGLVLISLGAGFGALLGGAWGGAAGVLASFVASRRRRIVLALLLAAAGPFAGVVLSLWRFYSSPMVYAYDPFFGFFAGPLYDTVIEPIEGLLSYRLGSLFSLVAVGVLAWHLDRRATGLVLVWRRQPAVALAGALALAGSLAISLNGAALGHWSTTESIRAELGRTLSSERCEIVHAPTIIDREVELFGRECDAHVRALERWFEIEHPERIVAFLFESPQQKGRLMGAANTYIAKPWRREVYLQWSRYPHPVLGHELAHVVAGAFGRGPFRVAGPLAGLVPDPGRIEGLASAAAPDDDADLTQLEWARAMLDLGLLPPLERVFRLTFLGENSAKAYTVAGAFVSWIRQTRGAAAVRGWYAGAPLEQVAGAPLGELEVEWHRSLAEVRVPPAALESARARFDRPAIFARRCPHVVDRLLARGSDMLGRNDWRGASRAFDQALALDSRNVWALVGSGTCAARAGRYDQARERWSALASDERLPPLVRARGLEAIADLDLSLGLERQASARYREIEKQVFADDHARALEIKASPPHARGRDAIVALLIGDPRLGRDFSVAAVKLARWSAEHPEQAEPDYLIGRNFYLQGRYEEAADRLDQALLRTFSSARFRSEALRMRLVVACALGQTPIAGEMLAKWQTEPGSRAARREGVARFAGRCGVAAQKDAAR
jgi:tetratricopeptide (TPR) repeat protein